MFFKKLFGRGDDPAIVMSFAETTITSLLPDYEVQRVGDYRLGLRRGPKELVWNLGDVIRRADASWKDEVEDLAGQIAERLRHNSSESPDAEHAFDLANVVVLVWPTEKIRGLRPDWLVSEPLAPGLHLFYGLRGGGTIRNVKPEELAEHAVSLQTLRTHAVKNLGLTLESLDVEPIYDGAPILTNHEGNGAATSLFADANTCAGLEAAMGGAFLVALPAPSRFFIAPARAALVPALEVAVQKATEIEEQFLSSRVFRVSGGVWTDVSGH